MRRLSIARPLRALFLAFFLTGLPAVAQFGAPAAAQEMVIAPSGHIGLDLREGKVISVATPLGSVFVADPEIADVSLQSPTAVYIFGKSVGQTTVFLSDEAGNVVSGRTVTVSHDVATINAAVAALYPGADVSIRSIGRSLVVEGALASPADIDDIRSILAGYVERPEDVVMRLGLTAPNQINLRVRVAELSREVDNQLGIRWASLFGDNTAMLGFAGGAGTGADDSFSSAVHIVTGSLDVNVVVDALAQEGLVSILAEPNLTAVSGESASFLAGGEFPVPVAQSDDTVTVEFKQFGVGLTFTPTLIDANRISLQVEPEVSELDFTRGFELSGTVVPALTTRRASTTVELGSGQSFAIAGLLRSTTSQTVARLPGLGDLPVLGALFRSTSFRQGETELVIIVTPYVVRPVESVSRLPLPTDGYRPASEIERLLFGSFQTGASSPPAARLAGSAGFILE